MNESFMKEKPVLPLIASMGLPMMISMLVNSLYNIVDSYFVARISEDAMTALSLVFPLQNFINAVAIGFGVGITAVISFHLGAGHGEQANRAAAHGVALSVLHGAVLAAACIAVMPAFLRMFTGDGTVVGLGSLYAAIAFAFAPVIAVQLAFEKIFQAVGQMKVTMVCLMCGCLTNIVFDPVLIFGLGPFPAMGIAGAALATGAGQIVTLALYLTIYRARPIAVRLERRYLVRDWALDRSLYAVGVPATLNLALPSLLISSLNGILAGFSQIYVVILGVYYKLQTFLYLPANGIIQGIRPLVGYNHGAGEHERVRQIYRVTLCMTGAIMALGTALCLAFPGQLIGLFTENGETIRAGQAALRIISAGFLVSAVSVTSCGALEGLGKGTPSLVISLCRYVVVIIPAAFALSRVWGPAGVWHAFWIAETVTAAIAFVVYHRSVAVREEGR